MDITIPALDYSFSVGLTNVLFLIGGGVIMFFFDRWVLGRKFRDDLSELRREKSVTDVRLSVLETLNRERGKNRGNSVSRRDSLSSVSQPETQHTEDNWLASPGAGRTAAKLIMTVPKLEEAKRVYGGFVLAPQRTDTAWANWAFVYRLEEAGLGQEVFRSTLKYWGGEDDDFILDEEMQKEIISWREGTWTNETDN